MPILIRNIRLGLDDPEDRIPALAARRLGVTVATIRSYAVVRRSLDARKKSDIHFTYHVEVALDEPRRTERRRMRKLTKQQAEWIEPHTPHVPRSGDGQSPARPMIVGLGPAGMFAALRLSQLGYRPIVFERGRELHRRNADITKRFYREGQFDPASNLLFGEGGAGTYSDGKLYTRVRDPLVHMVLETLYQHGGNPDILVDARPHIGSDRLPSICSSIRRKIELLGGEVCFEHCVDDIRLTADGPGDSGSPDAARRLAELHVTGPGIGSEGKWMTAGPTIFAIGHSARDTIRMLDKRGVQLASKPFQIGVRIEHSQSLVDRWQYGALAGHPRLGPAEYHLVARDVASDHGNMFSFCMCPGGTILPGHHAPGLIATNGGSRSDRSGPFANSGLVITMDPGATNLNPVEGLAYQERWERLAFQATDGSYRVPAQRAADYLVDRLSDGQLDTSYPLGGEWSDIRGLIPEQVSSALDRALVMLDEKLPGFAGAEAIITAPETRASSPIRILRDQNTRQAVGIENLYPTGEGAGYAGGIVSSAIDGIVGADKIIERFARPS